MEHGSKERRAEKTEGERKRKRWRMGRDKQEGKNSKVEKTVGMDMEKRREVIDFKKIVNKPEEKIQDEGHKYLSKGPAITAEISIHSCKLTHGSLSHLGDELEPIFELNDNLQRTCKLQYFKIIL